MRRWRAATLALASCGLLAAVGFGTRTFEADEITAKTIRVTDDKGAVRISLSAAGVGVLDEKGTVRAAIGTTDEGGVSLSLHDPAGNVRIGSVVDAERAAMTLLAPVGQGVAVFGADVDGAALLFRDGTGTDRAGLTALKDQPAALFAADSKGKVRIAVGGKDDGGEVAIMDPDGKQTHRFPPR